MKRMNPEAKKKWLIALRSGRYKQGHMFLWDESTDSHCCLGVLQVEMGFSISERPSLDLLSPECARACGLPVPRDKKYGEVSPRNTQKILAHMNDEEGMSFSEIADWIEKNL